MSVPDVDQIEDRERDVLSRLPIETRHVPRSESEEYDAELVSPYRSTPPLSLVEVIALAPGTPLELKTCQVWLEVNFSNGDRRRGRFYVNEETHAKLVERDGAYVWVLLDDRDEVVTGRVTPARSVEDVFSWHETGTTYSSRRAAVPWDRVIPREAVPA